MIRNFCLSDEEIQFNINMLKFMQNNFEKLFSPEELQQFFNYSQKMNNTIYIELERIIQIFQNIV